LCVIILHTLVHIHNFITITSKMSNKVILRYLGIIPESDDSECVDECDC